MPDSSKLDKLIAAYDEFHSALAGVDDDDARMLVSNWTSVRPKYASPSPGWRPSELAAGMEEGLRDLVLMTGMMKGASRQVVSRMLARAIAKHHPDFLAKQEQRLANIRAKGRIASSSQFYLVRNAIDVAEGRPEEQTLLRELHALVDAYEARGRRR